METLLNDKVVIDFLASNGASYMAKIIGSIPQLSNPSIMYKLALIPNNSSIENLISLIKFVNLDKSLPVNEKIQILITQYSKEFFDIILNYFTIRKLNKTPPSFNAINGRQHGTDKESLGINDDRPYLMINNDKTMIVIIDKVFTFKDQLIEKSWSNLPYDVFLKIILDNNIVGEDLISLCSIDKETSDKCDSRNYNLFRILLKKQFNVDNSNNPKDDYITWSRSKVFVCGLNFSGNLGLGHQNHMRTITLNPNLRGIVSIANRTSHSIFIDKQNKVFVCGRNTYGELGIVGDVIISNPTLNPNVQDIVSAACGDGYTIFINKKGQVFVCGHNDRGQLGIVDLHDTPIPVLNPNLKDIVSASCGREHTIFLNRRGQVFVCGSNYFGQLGLNNYINYQTTPVLISKLKDIIAVACGERHSIFLNRQGQVFVCGNNNSGELGLGHYKDTNTPELIHTIKDIISYGIGYDITVVGPILNPYLKDIVSISGGYGHSAFVNRKGQVFVCGRNADGEIGLGYNKKINIPVLNPLIKKIVSVSCGMYSTIFIDKNKNIHICGNIGINNISLAPTSYTNFENIVSVACGGENCIFLQM